jgi:hypothetical protein
MARFLLLAVALSGAAVAQPVAYPNPVGGPALTVETDAPDAAFELVDVLGRRVEARSALAPGVYLWRLRLADGSHTDAQPLTKLTAGPLDVRMVRPSAPRAQAPLAAAQAERRDCRVAASTWGGFQHEPRRGASLATGAALVVQRTNVHATALTCLGAAGGVGVGYLDASSPYVVGDQLDIEIGASPVDAPQTDVTIPVSIKTVNGQFGDIRLGLDASSPKLVEVVAFDPDGSETVVASTTVPADEPVTRRLARVSAPGGTTFELTDFSAQTTRYTDELRDSLFSARLSFGTDAPGGVTVQINGATVQGDAVRITMPLDQRIMFETLKQESDGAGYVVDDLAVQALVDASPPALQAAGAQVPAWLRTADPDGLMTTDAGTVEVRCARGASCSTYGVRATDSFITEAGAHTPGVAPGMPGVVFSGLTTGPGRGLLFGTGAQVDLTMDYALDGAALDGASQDGELTVFLSTPPASRSVVVDFRVFKGPLPSEAEVRYIRDGVVRRQFEMAPDTPVDLGLRLELTDVHVTTAPDGSMLIRATDTVRANSSVEVDLGFGPSALDYLTITMTNAARWSTTNVVTTADGNPEEFQAAR